MAGFFAAAVGVASPPIPSGTQQYDTGSGNFTVPAGVTEIEYEAWGGGASGGYGLNDTIDGGSGGGGSGGWIHHKRSCTPGENIAYSVGVGGALVAPAYGADGNDGGDTTVDGYLAGGGLAGHGAAWFNDRAGGDGGDVSLAPLYKTPGNPGTAGTLTPTAGNGGDAPNGGLGGDGPVDISSPLFGNGAPGVAPGGAGSGCIGGGTGSGAGADGRIIFRWGTDMTI